MVWPDTYDASKAWMTGWPLWYKPTWIAIDVHTCTPLSASLASPSTLIIILVGLTL